MPTLQIDRTTLAYTDEGQGQPVILVHGSASSRGQWRPLIKRLSSRYRLLAPDLYGYGKTSGWHGERPLEIDDEAALIRALIEHAGEPCHLVGHSYGGQVSFVAAQGLDRELRSLTLIEPTAFPLLRAHGETEAWNEIRQVAEQHIELVEQKDLRTCADKFMGYWIGAQMWQLMPPQMRDPIIETMPKIAAEWRMMLREVIAPRSLEPVTRPSLLIRATRTTLAASRVIDVLQKLIPHASLVEIQGGGHMSPITHAEPVNAAIEAHLDRHAAEQAR